MLLSNYSVGHCLQNVFLRAAWLQVTDEGISILNVVMPQMVDSQVEPCLGHYTQELGQHLKSPFTTAENHLRLGRINVHHRRGWGSEEYQPSCV